MRGTARDDEAPRAPVPRPAHATRVRRSAAQRAGRAPIAVVAVVAVAAVVTLCGCAGPPSPHGALVPSSARLAPPPSIDPGVRGASYLTAVAAQLQPRWSDFLEDCRLRLPASHPLNVTSLSATFDLAIGKDGVIVERKQVETSGNGDFDTAIADVLADASPLPSPPSELWSDDELAHVRWSFARDRRQAGPATARVLIVELPLLGVIDSLLDRGELGRAARRVASTPPSNADRDAAAERVMVAALREALASPNGVSRRTAVDACGRARVHALAGAVRSQLVASADPELRLAAITAAGALGDGAAAPALRGALRDDLVQQSRVALARVAALAAVGHAQDAAQVVRSVLDTGPHAIALEALFIVPIPAIASRLAGWATNRDPAIRGAVCAALPAAAPDAALALIARGLRDPDAMVRARCAGAASREDAAHPDAATVKRLRELARDRDRSVRARAVAALGILDPQHPVRASQDPAPEVRAAYAAVASEAELRKLIVDREPEVRAAAVTALGDRRGQMPGGGDLDDAAGGPMPSTDRDPSAAVRRATIRVRDDAEALARLTRDDSPEVATPALVRLTALRGRAAMTPPLLDQLAASPPGSPERARIALAWLLAS